MNVSSNCILANRINHLNYTEYFDSGEVEGGRKDGMGWGWFKTPVLFIRLMR